MSSVRFTDHSGDIISSLGPNIERALEAIGAAAEGYAKNLCPVETGALRNSIAHAVQDNTVYIGTNVEYAPYVEFGTGPHNTLGGGTLVVPDKDGNPRPFAGQRPQPYLKPALADHISEYEAYLKSML